MFFDSQSSLPCILSVMSREVGRHIGSTQEGCRGSGLAQKISQTHTYRLPRVARLVEVRRDSAFPLRPMFDKVGNQRKPGAIEILNGRSKSSRRLKAEQAFHSSLAFILAIKI